MTADGQADSTERPVVGSRVRVLLGSKELSSMGDTTVIKETAGELRPFVDLNHSQDTIEVALCQNGALLLLVNSWTT